MSKVCIICGKGPVVGRNISHSHRVTSRLFRPNIQRLNILQDGRKTKANVCTKCLKANKVTKV